MHDLSAIEIVGSIIITWVIGLTPPLVIRYAILRRPMGKGPAIGMSALFWFANIVLFTALGSQNKTHAVLLIIAFVSYAILRAKAKGPVAANRARHDLAADDRLVPSHTEAKLRRFAILIALASGIGFGGASAYSFYREHSFQAALAPTLEILNKAKGRCETDPNNCGGWDEYWQKSFDGFVALRDEHGERASTFLTAAIATPILSFLLFFGLRWVLTGRLRGRGVASMKEPSR